MNTQQPIAPLFLESAEVEILTGFKLVKRQAQWLSAKGWRFELNGNQKPIVARKYAEKMLGCGTDAQPSAPHPNFNALRST